MVSSVINFNCSVECLSVLQVFMTFTRTHGCAITCLLKLAGLLVHARDFVTLENLEGRQKASSRASQSSI